MAYQVTCEKAPKGKSILKTGDTIQQLVVDNFNDAKDIKDRWHKEAHQAGIAIWVTIDPIDLR